MDTDAYKLPHAATLFSKSTHQWIAESTSSAAAPMRPGAYVGEIREALHDLRRLRVSPRHELMYLSKIRFLKRQPLSTSCASPLSIPKRYLQSGGAGHCCVIECNGRGLHAILVSRFRLLAIVSEVRNRRRYGNSMRVCFRILWLYEKVEQLKICELDRRH